MINFDTTEVTLDKTDGPVEVPRAPFFNTVYIVLEVDDMDYELNLEDIVVDIEVPDWVSLGGEFKDGEYGVYRVEDYYKTNFIEQIGGKYELIGIKVSREDGEDDFSENNMNIRVKSNEVLLGTLSLDMKSVVTAGI